MLICVSRRVVVGAAATAGVFHAQPLKEQSRMRASPPRVVRSHF